MKILIRAGDGLHRDTNVYQEFIQKNIGKYLEVDTSRLKSKLFFVKPKFLNPDGVEVGINGLDVLEVLEDMRLGRSFCGVCGAVTLTGQNCGCPSSIMSEFFPGSKVYCGVGFEELIESAFEELLPNVK